MPKLKKIIVIVATFIVLGTVAKVYNTTNHQGMAIEKCGSTENIKRVDEVGFECITELDN